jgi:hypothetical protein
VHASLPPNCFCLFLILSNGHATNEITGKFPLITSH